MPDDKRKDLSAYRLEQAMQCLATAKLTLTAGDYKAAANRSYYCIFHAMRSVLALDALDSRKHSGIISMFRQKYIRDGAFDADYSDIILDAFKMRGSSDYDDFYLAPKAKIEKQISDAERFYLLSRNILRESNNVKLSSPPFSPGA